MRHQSKRVILAALFVCGGVLSSFAEAADPNAGAGLYNTHCTGCHGPKGTGMMPGMPNFTRGEGLLRPDAELVSVIEEGRNVMPAYRGLMTTEQILDVIAFLRTLN